MTIISWALFLSGTLLATATGAHDPPMWGPFSAGIVLAVLGALLLRRQEAAGGSGPSADAAITDLASLGTALRAVTAQTAGLATLPEGEPGLRDRVESLRLDHLLPVVEGRGFLARAHGIEVYAQVFTPLAGGERCLNRAWSALADGNPAEARAQLQRAQAHLEQAVAGFPAG